MNNMQNMLSSLMSNPMQILTQRGFNLPQNMNDPQAIVQHLLNSGQVSQAQVNRAVEMSKMWGGVK